MHHFWDELSVAWTTPQTGLIATLCSNTSKSCGSLESTASQLLTKKRHYRSNPVRIDSIDAYPPQGDTQRVLSQGLQLRTDILNSDGTVASTDSEKPLANEFTLRWQVDVWRVQSIKVVTQ